MDIIIQSLGFTASEHLKSFVHEKLDKLKSQDDIVRANVTLFEDAAGDMENKFCEIRLEVPGNDHFVKKGDTSYEAAINSAADTLQKIMRRSREKEMDKRHSGQ